MRTSNTPINHLYLPLVRRVVRVALRRREVPIAIHSCNVRIGTPAAAIAVPNVCRRSWKRWPGSTPAAFSARR